MTVGKFKGDQQIKCENINDNFLDLKPCTDYDFLSGLKLLF